jgi:hypothetical protein
MTYAEQLRALHEAGKACDLPADVSRVFLDTTFMLSQAVPELLAVLEAAEEMQTWSRRDRWSEERFAEDISALNRAFAALNQKAQQGDAP